MRISTRQIYTQGIEAFQQQQQKLARLQQQISSGVRLNKPSDDPAAASRVLELEQDVSVHLQYQANINLAEQRLGQQDAVMKTYADLLNRVHPLQFLLRNGIRQDPVFLWLTCALKNIKFVTFFNVIRLKIKTCTNVPKNEQGDRPKSVSLNDREWRPVA